MKNPLKMIIIQAFYWRFETEDFSGKNGALKWSILVRKQKHGVQWSKRKHVPREFIHLFEL